MSGSKQADKPISKDYYTKQLTESNLKQRWKCVKDLLHSNDPVVNSSETANASLCANFANYFTDKIDKLRQSVASKIPSGTPA